VRGSPEIVVEPVNPDYTSPASNAWRDMIEDSRRAGDSITENADGSVTRAPDPNVPPKRRFELLKEACLQCQREREKLAKHPDYD
jgi:hypothetical protein